jgi:hypothetical protein
MAVLRGSVRGSWVPGQDGSEASMTDYLLAAVIFIFIVAVLVTLWRREHR